MKRLLFFKNDVTYLTNPLFFDILKKHLIYCKSFGEFFMAQEKKKNGFASAIGFILAAAGSAVGLGNLWAFPYKVSANGGAAFVLVYIASILLIGLIAMIAEILLGKRSQANTVTAFKKIHPKIGWIGVAMIAIPFLITCYYSVLGGWTLRYAVNSFATGDNANALSFSSFTSNAFKPVLFTFLFLALTAIIIKSGVKSGIEKASKVLMPTLFLILVAITIFCLCLGEGVTKGLNYYLNPNFAELGFDGVLAAMSQAFYSLSLGMGIMVCYGSYTGNQMNLGKSAVMISVFDTIIALLCGLAIFSALGALDPDSLTKAQGPSLLFVILPKIFQEMGGIGTIVSFLFFAMVAIAALTSVISLVEVSAQFAIQKFKLNRIKATLTVCLVCFLLSIPVTWSVGGAFDGAISVFGFDLLTFLDEMTNTVLMPLGAMGSCIAMGWLLDKKITANPMKTLETLREEGLSLGKLEKVYVVMLKYVTPLIIFFMDIMGIITKIRVNPSYWWIIGASLFLIGLAVAVYFLFLKNTETGTNADEQIDNAKEQE